MAENRLVRAQRITMEVMRDPEWRDRDVSEQFEECKRRIDLPDPTDPEQP